MEIDWSSAFPHEDASAVVAALCEAWSELADSSPHSFHVGAREPLITELLCEYVQRVVKQRTKLTGQWSYERRAAKLKNKTGKGISIGKRFRTDIEYFSDRYDPPLILTFEFKKLNHAATRREAYLGPEGLLRFVTGDYSPGQPVAAMVGVLTSARERCVPPLVKLLGGASQMKRLKMKKFATGPVNLPSTTFPAFAEFDTQHERKKGLAPAGGAIIVSHIFLSFP